MAAAILGNDTMLTWPEKLQVGVPLLPMMVGGQEYIDAQDELSVLEWMRRNGMPEARRGAAAHGPRSPHANAHKRHTPPPPPRLSG